MRNPGLEIQIVSDVVCPWCFIGKRRLDAALEILRGERPDFAPEIRWAPYFLNPDTPPEGEPYRAFLERKFGGPAQVDALQARVAEAGRTAGIAFAFDRIRLRPNTLRAHRLIHRRQQAGDATPLAERLFAAHFLQGEPIGDPAVLARLAGLEGMDEGKTLRYLESDEDAEEVRSLAQRAVAMQVSGVPFFVLARRFAVPGAQTPEILVDALRRCLAAR